MPRLALLVRCALASKCVEHPCKQCGTLIEDGRPFCPQCRAPQIHVHVATPDVSFPSDLIPTKDFSSDIRVETSLSSSQMRLVSRNTLDRTVATHAALKAGVLGVFIGVIPFFGVVLTGYLAV